MIMSDALCGSSSSYSPFSFITSRTLTTAPPFRTSPEEMAAVWADGRRGGGADLTKIQPAGIRTKSGGARSIEAGKGPAGSGLSLGVAGVENGGRKDATFLRPPW